MENKAKKKSLGGDSLGRRFIGKIVDTSLVVNYTLLLT